MALSDQDRSFTRVPRARLDGLDADIQKFEAKAKVQRAEMSENYHGLLANLKSRRENAHHDLQDLKKASGDAWEKLQGGMEKTFGAAQDIFKDVKRQLEKA